MEASFGVYAHDRYFEGVLLYKLQRNHATNIDNQPNSSTESIKNTATNIYLLVVWDFEDDHHEFRVCLIECTANFIWNEDKLWVLYWEYKKQFLKDYESNPITWSMNGCAVIETRFDVTYESDYKLDITISEGTTNHEVKEPMKINPKG
jgi:hypothetical protein